MQDKLIQKRKLNHYNHLLKIIDNECLSDYDDNILIKLKELSSIINCKIKYIADTKQEIINNDIRILKTYIFKKYGFDIIIHNAKFKKENEIWKLQCSDQELESMAIATISYNSYFTPEKSLYIRKYLNYSTKKLASKLKWTESKIINLENHDFDHFILNHEEFVTINKLLKLEKCKKSA